MPVPRTVEAGALLFAPTGLAVTVGCGVAAATMPVPALLSTYSQRLLFLMVTLPRSMPITSAPCSLVPIMYVLVFLVMSS
jgi:hypothetical protein